MIHGPDFVAIGFESACSQHSLHLLDRPGQGPRRDSREDPCALRQATPGRQNFGRHNMAIQGITRRIVDNVDGSELMLPRLAAFTVTLPRRPAMLSPNGPRSGALRRSVPSAALHVSLQAARRPVPQARARTRKTSASSLSAPRPRNGTVGTLLQTWDGKTWEQSFQRLSHTINTPHFEHAGLVDHEQSRDKGQ